MRAARSALAALTALLLLALPASAQCTGQNLLDLMSPDERAALIARAEAQPFARGNGWVATKDDQTVTLIGTYHLGDPRHDAVIEAVSPRIDAATTVLVEAGPAEQQQLVDLMARDPSLLVLTDTSLPEMLGPEDWASLSAALQQRGIPAFMAAKFQPWYISLMLATPPCALAAAAARDGLDARVIDRAKARGIPIQALEPYDSVFRIFDLLPMPDQIDMILYSLAMESRAADFSATLADSYFSGQSQLAWDLMRHHALHSPGRDPAKTEADLALMEEAMVTRRNQAWIPVIEAAAARGPVLAAFGALHLPGRLGIPNLLAERGWTLTPLPLPLP